MNQDLLTVSDLSLRIRENAGVQHVVNEVSFSIARGEVLALVGESGCGKTLTALSIVGLLPEAVEIDSGVIDLDGQDVVSLEPDELRLLRGARVGFVFQDPSTALNPVLTIGSQLCELLRLDGLRGAGLRDRAVELLTLVGIAAPQRRLDSYPHELSGGMRQRVLIAMALSRNPALLVADEPTTALDATVQAQILDLLRSLQQRLDMAVLIISHDLGLVADLADRIAVMYAGYIVEIGTARDVLEAPAHPYTQGLLRCLPTLAERRPRLFAIEGSLPDPRALPHGCPFWPRCELRRDPLCESVLPPLTAMSPNHAVRMFYDAIPVVGPEPGAAR